MLAVWSTQSVCSCIGMRKSWQSRPRHAQQCNPHNQLMPCMSSVRSTQSAIDGAALDARVMARNVCRDLVFEASSHAACSHSDLGGCADGTAEALPARQTASIRCWHARCNCLDCHEFSSTPLRFRPHPRMPMQLSFRPHPRMQLQLHTICALSTTRLVCGNCLTVVAPRHGAAAPHRA